MFRVTFYYFFMLLLVSSCGADEKKSFTQGLSHVESRAGDRSVILHWQSSGEATHAEYEIGRALKPAGPFQRLNSKPLNQPYYLDFDVVNQQTYYYQIRELTAPGENSIQTAVQPQAMDDSTFLDLVQRTTFDFFWKEANPVNGLIKDRSRAGAAASIASVGFGLTAIGIG
ncbi:hypothetical protein L0128_14620, partial [candidate division KSB1 bacterium]|nr:hypothetical protein [candidate division KSB1 bacterium]